ncbi:MAG: hypothetical protein H0U44_10115 [Flavisolibacter sp.]|jgi:hypothetical protein|nr:hypothetical protein [Flavisolibacter sp.]
MKKVIRIFSILALLALGWFMVKELTRGNKDLKEVTADYIFETPALIAAFEKDSALASKQYVDKIISVSGNVKTIDAHDNPVVIILGAPGKMSSVLFSMDSTYAEEYKNIREGDQVRLKGVCTGGESQELFGTDIKFNRAVVENLK